MQVYPEYPVIPAYERCSRQLGAVVKAAGWAVLKHLDRPCPVSCFGNWAIIWVRTDSQGPWSRLTRLWVLQNPQQHSPTPSSYTSSTACIRMKRRIESFSCGIWHRLAVPFFDELSRTWSPCLVFACSLHYPLGRSQAVTPESFLRGTSY